MASVQRAFAQKLSKQNAADVRRHASSTSRDSSWSSCSTRLSGCITSISLNDVVEPLDYEDFILQHRDLIDRDPLRHIFQFPENDIEVNIIPRSIRTEKPITPEEPPDEWSCQVKDSVQWLTRDFVVVNYNYRCNSTSWSVPITAEERQELARSLPRQEFEVDLENCNFEANCNGKSVWDSYSEGGSVTSEGRRSSWASLDLRHSESDRLDLNLLDRIPPEHVDQLNSVRRLENRQKSFFNLYPSQEEDDLIERRLRETMPQEHIGHRIFLKCKQLRLELDVEPIFLTLALYDAKEKKKISENFYTDLNSEEIKNMLQSHIEYSDTSTRSRSCIFNVTHPSPDLFLVIKLEKVLQGDIAECAEPYMKEEKNKDKVKFNAVAACERLGKFRMPLGWTAISLMNLINNEASSEKDDQTSSSSNSLDRKSSNSSLEGLKRRANMSSLTGRGSLDRYSGGDKRRSWSPEDLFTGLDSFRPLTINISSFFRQESERLKDEDLYKFLQDLKRPCYLMKKLKVIPGVLQLEISPCPDDLKCVLTPELARVVPYPDQKERPVKEILEFPAHEIFTPHDTYRNLLFVYPKELNFTNRGVRDLGSARNLVVKVQLKSGETVALESIFGKSSCPEFTTEAYTSVSYHNRCPSFYDEIKIKLPAKLGPQHHLFFTLYHISCKRKPENPPVETPVGYTWIPLLNDGRLRSGELSLPVMMDPPPPNYCYIPPDVLLPGTRWLDNHRGVFLVNIEANSSVHPQDKYIDRFLCLCACLEEGTLPPLYGETNIEKELKKSISELNNAKMEPLVRFLPLVFDKLLTLLVRPPVVDRLPLNLGQALLESVANLVQNITLHAVGNKDQHNRHSLLATYIQYQCSVPGLILPNGHSFGRMQKSCSDPDLKGDFENGLSAMARGLDRTASMRTGRRDENELLAAPRSSLHEEIALQWVVSSVPARDLAMSNSWFFLELIIKSMTETLWRVEGLDTPRQLRYSEQFCDDITTLVQTITAEIISKHNKDPKASQSLNTSIAFFIFDLFSIMDRGLVLGLIRTYYKQMTAKTTSLPDAHAHALIGYKLDFLRIVLSHEHLIPLNLPIQIAPSGRSSPSPSVVSSTSQTSLVSTLAPSEKMQTTELTPQFRSQHYLIGLLLTELSAVLECQNPCLHKKVVNSIRNLMTSHDRDSRYSDPVCKARVASLYMPLLGIILRALPLLHKSATDITKNVHEEPEPIRTMVAAAISGTASVPVLEDFVPQPQPMNRNKGLNAETTKHLLGCFLWLLKNLDRDLLRNWFLESSVTSLRQLLDAMNICLRCFEYLGKKWIKRRAQKKFGKDVDIKAKLEDVILGQGSARSEMMMRRKEKNPPSPGWAGTDSASNNTDRLRWRKEQKLYKPASDGGLCPQAQAEADAAIEGNLSTEATLVILDTLEMIVQVICQSNSFQGQGLLGDVLGVILRALSCNQSNEALHNLFGTQRSIVYKFPNLLFDEETEHCADLCLQLLTHCSSLVSPVRAHAAASLYLLMRQNFEIGNNFARVKMQVTMSLSSLVGTSQSYSEEALRRALKNILVFAEEDNGLQDTTFPEQVRDLVFNLHMILSDMVKMKEFQEDPEMLLDLMYRIAKGYQNSPDLRLTWLANMAQKHMEHNNHTEAAMCLVHSAALVAEYLHMLEDQTHLPIGAVSFDSITPNALEESAVSDDVLSPDEEGVCLGNYFTESGLVGLLEHAANSFHTAGMYEAMNDVYKILIPIAEEARDYKKLANIHGKLQEAFTKIEQLQGKRVFGTYFRVGFYGSKFGDLDGEEFIYKEPTLTKLPEIFNRLENFYSERFGLDNMVIIKDSNTVDPKTLDPDKGYIQITYVEPYFDTFEVPRHRATYFHKNFNIKRFVYYTPFTISGRAHGELQEQCKRRTVLTTANHFPYIKTRIQVVDRQQSVVTPIEGAIEDLQKKTAELAAATYQEPPDPKILQMVLQGCIGTTVNQGPMEVALVFLSDLQDGRTPNRLQTKLRLCFKDFSKKCSDALRKNKNLIGPDQRDYQKELERNYHKFIDRLTPLLGRPL
ncbi:UNVERIFIED_CONTAM: hypothetical protein PYX00_001439 [Menopon gallinae]|uniref:Dedicator of cytokinesis protein 7 n=1 Tax=Menopon gallinae TaxID=328185 RepID=A0AAW2IDK7_9NEOP